MRIAMLGVKAVPTIGGIARYVEEVGARLVERGHEVTVYCRPHYLNGSRGPYRGMERVVVRGVRGKHLDTITHTLTSLCDALPRRFDILHFHGVGPAVFSPLARWRNGHTIVVTAHGADWDREKWGWAAKSFLRAGTRAAAKWAANWVAVSHSVADECARVAGSRPEVIPSGVNPTDTPPPQELYGLGLAPRGYLFCAGRLTPEKGLHYLIEAHQKARTDKRLVIAGSCPHKSRYVDELRRLANDQVLFPGFVQGRLLQELFGHAYLYCQPSNLEGLPLSVLEAMSHGTCVLASDIAAHLEALDGHGFTFRAGDVDDLAAKLQALLADPARVQATGLAAREHVCRHRTWDVTTDHYEALYENLVSEKRAGLVPDGGGERRSAPAAALATGPEAQRGG